jgi:ribose/xylose/arabinose/galactoside ABC-type transport system permease subunit
VPDAVALHKKQGSRTGGWVGRNWALLFLLLEVVVFSSLGSRFYSLENIQNIFVACTTILLLGMGQTFVIITGGIDLSVGFVMGFSTVICAKFMLILQAAGLPETVSIPLAALICLAIGLIPGLVNGTLVARLKVPPFLATFGMYGIAYGVSEIISQNTPISGLPSGAGLIGNEYFLYIVPRKLVSFLVRPQDLTRLEMRSMISLIPIIVVIALVFVLIFAFVLKRTRFGRHTYAIGGSVDASLRAGINVTSHLTYVYMISSFFASLAGVIFRVEVCHRPGGCGQRAHAGRRGGGGHRRGQPLRRPGHGEGHHHRRADHRHAGDGHGQPGDPDLQSLYRNRRDPHLRGLDRPVLP